MTSISTKEHPSSPSQLANIEIIIKKYKTHMGQFLQDGKNGRLMSYFF